MFRSTHPTPVPVVPVPVPQLSGLTTSSVAGSAASARPASPPGAPAALPVGSGRLGEIAAIPAARHLASVPELQRMSARVVAELARRQRAAVTAAMAALKLHRPSDDDEIHARYMEARQDLDRLEEALRLGAKEGLLDLGTFALAMDLQPPSTPDGAGVPLHLVPTQDWGWLAVRVATDALQAALEEGRFLIGEMDGAGVQAQPVGRAVAVPEDPLKAAWWAWAAAVDGRLLVLAG